MLTKRGMIVMGEIRLSAVFHSGRIPKEDKHIELSAGLQGIARCIELIGPSHRFP